MPDPVAKARQGRLSATVFENQNKTTGKSWRSVNVQTGYQKDGEWINKSISIFDNQIDSLVSCLTSIKDQLTVLDSKKK